MTSYIQHRHPLVFPRPDTFDPDRWLPSPTPSSHRAAGVVVAPHSNKPLTHYLVAFGRGPRSCLGQNFAMMELFLGLATVFRRFDFDLFETGEREVRMVSNFFAPFPEKGTAGLRVRVK